MKNAALIVAGIFFLLVAVAHAIRYHLGLQIIMDHIIIPMEASLYAIPVALLLAIWMFAAAACCNNRYRR